MQLASTTAVLGGVTRPGHSEELSSLHRVTRFSLEVWVRASTFQRDATSGRLRWPGFDKDNMSTPPLGECLTWVSRQRAGVDPWFTGGITYPIWQGNAWGSLMRSWRAPLVRGGSVTPCLAFCQRNPISDKRREMGEQLDECCPLIAYNHNAGYSFPFSYLSFSRGNILVRHIFFFPVCQSHWTSISLRHMHRSQKYRYQSPVLLLWLVK